jgi:hypothetical protein
MAAFYSLPYDVLNDFVPISPVGTIPLVLLARKTMPANDLNELIAWLRANPNKASAGIAAVGHRVVIAFFQKKTGTQFTLVPYRGSAPEMQDLVGGQIALSFDTPLQLPLSAGGEYKSLRRDKRHPLGASTRHSNLCGDGPASRFLCRLVRAFRAQGHAKGHHSQTQWGGCGRAGRPRGAISACRSRA